jgi:hypothetical protein
VVAGGLSSGGALEGSGGARFGMAVHCFPLMEVRKAPLGRPDMTSQSWTVVIRQGRFVVDW